MQAATAALLLTGAASVLSIALLQVIFGGATAFSRPAYQGLVPQTVPPEQLQPANALMGLSFSTVGIVGPALGALIVTAADPGWALAADAGTFVVSALLLLRLDLPRTVRVSGGSVLTEFKEGWHEVASRSWLVAIIVAFAVFQLTYFPAFLVLGPYVAKTELGGPGAWAIILAAEAAGALLGGVIALRVRLSRPLVATLFLTVPAAVVLLLLGAEAPLWLIAPVSFATGACFAIDGAVWFTTLQEKIPEHALSRVSSFDWFGSVALNPVGYALVGPLSEVIGVGSALALAGAVNLVSTLAMLLVPDVRSLRAGREAEA
jgi:predicted MFS family arabinose efflux permease